MFRLQCKKIFVLGFLIFISCSSSDAQLNKLSEEIIVNKFQPWLNLMPGGSASFHFTGEYSINKTITDNLLLKRVIVYSSQEVIYDIDSTKLTIEHQPDKQNQKLIYQFYTTTGIKLKNSIADLKTVNIKLIFESNGNEVEKMINDIKLERVY